MLNNVLEKNHEEVGELHFKLELMENHMVRKKHEITSAQALISKIKLIMGNDDPNFKILVSHDEHSANYDRMQ